MGLRLRGCPVALIDVVLLCSWPSVSAFFGWPERDSNDAHVISRGGALSRSQQSYYGMRNEAVQVPERG